LVGGLQVLVNTEVTVEDAHFKSAVKKKHKKMQFFGNWSVMGGLITFSCWILMGQKSLFLSAKM